MWQSSVVEAVFELEYLGVRLSVRVRVGVMQGLLEGEPEVGPLLTTSVHKK